MRYRHINKSKTVICLLLIFCLVYPCVNASADYDVPTFGVYPLENVRELKQLSWNMSIYTATQALSFPYEIENKDDGTSRIYVFPENGILIWGIICDGIILDFNSNNRLVGIGLYYSGKNSDSVTNSLINDFGTPIHFDDGYYWDTRYHEIDLILGDDDFVLYYSAHTSSDSKQYSGSGNTVVSPSHIENGQILISPDYECVCPFSVSVSGDTTYYIYLKYLYAPTISTTSRVKLPGKTNVNNIADISFFVLPNSTAEIDVPIGVYKLYYCYGKEWLGRDEKFGESTRFAASDDLLTFYTDTEYYQGHSLELWAQLDGNFEDHPISEDDFPDNSQNEFDLPIPNNSSHL